MPRLDAAAKNAIALDLEHGAQNYHPLPVVLVRGKGTLVWDTAGKRYLDFLSSYSALNQGHCHPRIAAAARAQLSRLTLTSRAFHHTLMGPLLKRLCALTGQDRAILMNSGAEAVETAIKAMRLWGYKKKGIAPGRAEIVVAAGNFHGRTTTIVGFSSDPGSRDPFAPATPGFRTVPFGSAEALEEALGPDTCGVLLEPIQGEGGVLIPPPGYLQRVRELCDAKDALLCVDEVQTGLGRTGRMFCVDHEGVKPDLIVLGKALSGGYYPVSAVAGAEEVLGLFRPGSHGSTFGGNPLACAVASAALDVVVKERLPQRAAELGAFLLGEIARWRHPLVKEARGVGLMVGLELKVPARPVCERLLERGLLAKDTHDTTIRLAPPLVVTKAQLREALGILRAALDEALA